MKKVITITFIILSAILILDGFNVWHAAVMFYVAGEIPGTHASISPTIMMSIFALLIGFIVARVGNQFILSLFQRSTLQSTQQST